MKKYFFISMAIIALLFTSCKKNDDSSSGDDSSENNNDTEQVQLLPVPVTVTDDAQNPLQILSFGKAIFDRAINNTKNVNVVSTTTIEYDGRVVLKKTTNNGSDVMEKDYYYNNAQKGLLDSIVITKNQQFDGLVTYTISNDKIQNIKIYNNQRNLTEEDSFTYNGDQLSQFTTSIQTAYGPLNMTGQIAYTGDNMTGFSVSGDFAGYTLTGNYTFEYDNKNYTELNVVTLEQPFVFLHNITHSSSSITVAGQTSNSQSSYTYSYNTEDYPSQSNHTTIDANGTVSGTTTFQYENK